MRISLPLILATLSVAAASAAFAYTQGEALDRLRLQTLQQQNMRAQEQSNVLRRAEADVSQAIADQHHAQTSANVRAVELRGSAAASPAADAPTASLLRDDVTLRRIQDRELDASNARLRAITPAQ